MNQILSASDFEELTSSLINLPLTHLWRGYGSAIFLEFGELSPNPRRRKDGTPCNPQGEWTVMIEWSWRIEGKRRIWCGSWSDEERWERAFRYLRNRRVASLSLFGRLPEIDLKLDNGLHLLSFMTSEGDPEWGLIQRSGCEVLEIGACAARLIAHRRKAY